MVSKWKHLVAALSVRPGRWARMREMGTARGAWSTVRRLNKRYPEYDFSSKGKAVWGRLRVGPDLEAEEMQWR